MYDGDNQHALENSIGLLNGSVSCNAEVIGMVHKTRDNSIGGGGLDWVGTKSMQGTLQGK